MINSKLIARDQGLSMEAFEVNGIVAIEHEGVVIAQLGYDHDQEDPGLIAAVYFRQIHNELKESFT